VRGRSSGASSTHHGARADAVRQADLLGARGRSRRYCRSWWSVTPVVPASVQISLN
jgi:hypothetical protein